MGLTKQYLRYVASAVFGLIGSQKGNIVFVTLRGEKGRYVAVPACEHVFIWDLRKGEKVSQQSTPRLQNDGSERKCTLQILMSH